MKAGLGSLWGKGLHRFWSLLRVAALNVKETKISLVVKFSQPKQPRTRTLNHCLLLSTLSHIQHLSHHHPYLTITSCQASQATSSLAEKPV